MDKKILEEPQRLDREGMLDDLDNFPRQVEEAIEIGKESKGIIDGYNFDNVCVTGMGGSAIVGDLLSKFIYPRTIVNRSYSLPEGIEKKDLLIAVSYSGNTEETLSALREGLEKDMSIVCISTGGKLKDLCEENLLPFVQIPKGYQPRASTGYMLFPLLEIFLSQGLAKDYDRGRLITRLKELSELYGSDKTLENNPAKQLSVDLYGKVPLVYGTEKNTKAVSYRWKTQFNENSKQPAFWNVFPELNHNETVGYELSNTLMGNAIVLILKNGLENERNELRIEVMKKILKENDITFRIIENTEGESIERIIGQIYYGDYVSNYLALLNEEDPSPVELIEKFKKEMKTKEV